jgi:hypothetical protein
LKSLSFNKLNDWKNTVLIVFSFLCVLAGSFAVLDIWNTELNPWLGMLGSLGICVFFARMTLSKYYVGWNKAGITIKVGSIRGHTIGFKEIKSIGIEDKLLSIQETDRRVVKFDCNEIRPKDFEKLLKVLEENSGISPSINTISK